MNSQFKMSKTTKIFLATLDKPLRTAWKKAMASAELHETSTERAMMLYDIAPNGKRVGQKG